MNQAPDPTPPRTFRGLFRDERGQAMVETVIVVGLVGLAIAWAAAELPKAITKHYVQTQDVLASPL